jgi:hypothetical protein
MNPFLTRELAREHISDLRRGAAKRRRLRDTIAPPLRPRAA